MLKIIGTTHLDSKEKIEGIIKEFNPDIIGVELCLTRYKIFTGQINITNSKKDDSLLGNITKTIKDKSSEANLNYASDMETAMSYAILNEIPILLLDRDITETGYLFSKIPKEEQENFSKALIEFQGKDIKEEMKILNEEEVLNELKTKYPVSFEFLINSRDLHIAFNILKAVNKYPDKKIIVFIGKGHEKEIRRLLNIQ
jgi:pheromone shutdown protein TraB